MGRLKPALCLGILMLIPLLVTGCGLDMLNYLRSDSMPKFISESTNGLIFSGPLNPAIPPYFGMNLYYRIYASESKARSDKASLDQRQGSEIVPGSSVPTFLVRTLRYERPARIENHVPPTIPESLESDSMMIELVDGRLYLNIDATLYELKRYLPSGLVDFSVSPRDEDTDYDNSPPTDPGPYYVQFFASSYGFDFLGSNPEVYSNAVYLGLLVLSGSE